MYIVYLNTKYQYLSSGISNTFNNLEYNLGRSVHCISVQSATCSCCQRI